MDSLKTYFWKHVTLWRIGVVRTIALLVWAGCLNHLRKHTIPVHIAILFSLCALAIYILGFRTERDYEAILKSVQSKGRDDDNNPARDDHTDSNG